MSNLNTTDDDVKKIHNEINQIVNQRYLITTVAITIYCVVANMLKPKDFPSSTSELGGLIYFGTILLLSLLLLLFLYSHFLKVMLRTLTNYLLVSEKSNWEIEWKTYRTKGYFGYTKAQTIIFLILGIFSFSYPFGIKIAYNLNYEPLCGLTSIIIFFIFYFILIIGIGFCHWFDFEKRSQEKWKEIK